MVGSDGVAKEAKAVCICDVIYRNFLDMTVLEEGWIVNVGAFWFPIVLGALVDLKVVPALGALCNFRVVLYEHLWLHDLVSQV
jgi:hypothetical protein